MDFFTFIIIGVIVYSLFSKKDKAPQRTRRPVDPTSTQPLPQERPRPEKKREGFFESLERQIRESAEAMERELETGRSEREPRKTTEKPVERSMEATIERTMEKPKRHIPKRDSYETMEGAWGVEGRSGSEGRAGDEGRAGVEGRSDYSRYQSTQGKVLKATGSVIEQTSVETGAQAIGTRRGGLEKAVGFSSTAIVQGVIWSEILKEPRGRRPFDRR